MAKPKVQIIQPSLDLRKRAVNFKTGFGVILTPEETVKLQAVVEKSSDGFVRQIAAKLKQLREALGALDDGEAPHAGLIERVASDALEIKGLGGTFKFPLLTQIAKSLHDYAGQIKEANVWHGVIFAHHIDALYVVLAQRITGLGGKVEAELLKALRQASTKYK
ncbi:MAG: transcriptional regulator [Tagaea sp. CACIAM 22H2]|nr:transcriptional regulator [Tagaea sp. CACIAM 22H2]